MSLRWTPRLALLMLALHGCVPSSTVVLEDPWELPEHNIAWLLPGPAMSRVERGELTSIHGCTIRYERREAFGGDLRAEVIMAHGFLRNETHMRGWAEHFASHGVSTTVARLCNSSLLNGHHDRNADDLRSLAEHVAPSTGRIYAGFSAGGLSALLASAADPLTRALLALDAVDTGELALRAGAIESPALILLADPGSCNADGNFERVRPRLPNARWIAIPNATHCHFEWPYDPRCEWLCGRVAPDEAAAAIRNAIKALATEWVVTTSINP